LPGLEQLSLLKDDEALLAQMKSLDSISIRDHFQVPFLYIKENESKSYEVNYLADTYFNEFLVSLGLILEGRHIRTGCFDHIRDLVENTGVVYSANCFSELVFLCPSLKPLKSPKVLYKHYGIGIRKYHNYVQGHCHMERENERRLRCEASRISEDIH
jgi:hypothetical protein